MNAGDCADVAELWRGELGAKRVTAESCAATLEKMSAAGSYRTFVAEAGGRVIGFATTVHVLAAELDGGYIKMNGIAVNAEHQRQGVGRALMRRAEELAEEVGAEQIGLASGLQRLGAHAFYDSLGYTKGSYWFGKKVDRSR